MIRKFQSKAFLNVNRISLLKGFILLLILSSCNHSSAKSSVLILEETVPIGNVEMLLNDPSKFISFADLIEARMGSVDGEILNSDYKNHQILPQEFLKKITQGILSPIRKKILLDFLKNLDSLEAQQLNININEQISSMNELSKLSEGTSSFPDESIRSDDRLYINGFKISVAQLKSLRLNPKVYYHISFISNVYQPEFQWSLGNKIENLKKIKLINGTCDNSLPLNINFSDTFWGVFSKNCMTKLTTLQEGLSVINRSKEPLLNSDKDQEAWSEKKKWAIGGSLVLLGIGFYEAQKNYHIRLMLPF